MAKKFLTGLTLVNLDSDPLVGSEGELYFNTSASVAKIYKSGVWTELGGGAAGGGVTISETAPSSPETGDLWYQASTGSFSVWDGTYWVEINGVIENNLTQEQIQDYIAPLFTHNNHTNVDATYDDINNEIILNTSASITNIDSIVYPDYITLDTSPETSSVETGTIFWDSGDGLPKAILSANVQLGIGQEQVALVKNATGSTIAKGKVVYINGAQGQRPTIALSDSDLETTSSKTLGVTAQSIASGEEGFVTTFGVLRGVNTNGLTEGSALWLSSTAGEYQTTIPSEPAHLVFVGYVVKAHANAGEIFVNPQNGYELNELHGVTIENNGFLTDNEILSYSSASGIWINKTLEEAGILNTSSTPQTKTGNLSLGGNLIISGDILNNDLSQKYPEITDGFISASVIPETIATTDYVHNYVGDLDLEQYLTLAAASSTYVSHVEADENFATKIYADNAVATASVSLINTIVGVAPELLNTIEEISNALNDDENFATTITNSLSNKLDISTASSTYLTQISASIVYATIDYVDTEIANLDLGGLPSQTGNNGKFLTTDGSTASWANVDALPSQTGNDGKYLTTNGASASWTTIDLSGYLTSETDPVFSASDAASITSSDISNWNTAYGWGNHASAGYLTSYSETDPVFSASDAASIISSDISNWNTAYGWGNHASAGYLTSYSETDTLESVTDRGSTSSNAISITNTTQATSDSTGALVVSGGLGVAKDLWVGGDLHVTGTTTTEFSKTVATHDNLIYLNAAIDTQITNAVFSSGSITYTADNTYTAGMDIRITDVNPSGFNISSADGLAVASATPTQFVVVKGDPGATYISGGIAHAKEESNPDLGFAGGYYSGGYAHAGLFRDASDGFFKFFYGYTPEPDESVNIDTGHPSFLLAGVSAGSLTLSTALGYEFGGTGLNSIGTANQVLKVNSGATGLEWGTLDALPSQTGNNGKFLTTDGSTASWAVVEALPSQTGNNGKYLTTNGSTASWATLDLSQYLTQASASSTYLTQASASSTYAPINNPTFTGTVSGITKSMVGLGNVENTALSTWAGSTNITTVGAISATSVTSTGNVISHITILTPTFTSNAYTLVLGDDGDMLMLNNGSTAGTVNIPTDASVNFPIGTQIVLVQSGSGQITVSATSPGTTTVNSTPGNKLRAQNSAATLIKTAANTWMLMGDLTA